MDPTQNTSNNAQLQKDSQNSNLPESSPSITTTNHQTSTCCSGTGDLRWKMLCALCGVLHLAALTCFFLPHWMLVSVGHYHLQLGVWGYCLFVNGHRDCRLFYHLTPWEAQIEGLRVFQVSQSVFMAVCYVSGVALFFTRNARRTEMAPRHRLASYVLDGVYFTAASLCWTGVIMFHVMFLKEKPNSSTQPHNNNIDNNNNDTFTLDLKASAGVSLIVSTISYSFILIVGFIVVFGREMHRETMLYQRRVMEVEVPRPTGCDGRSDRNTQPSAFGGQSELTTRPAACDCSYCNVQSMAASGGQTLQSGHNAGCGQSEVTTRPAVCDCSYCNAQSMAASGYSPMGSNLSACSLSDQLTASQHLRHETTCSAICRDKDLTASGSSWSSCQLPSCYPSDSYSDQLTNGSCQLSSCDVSDCCVDRLTITIESRASCYETALEYSRSDSGKMTTCGSSLGNGQLPTGNHSGCSSDYTDTGSVFGSHDIACNSSPYTDSKMTMSSSSWCNDQLTTGKLPDCCSGHSATGSGGQELGHDTPCSRSPFTDAGMTRPDYLLIKGKVPIITVNDCCTDQLTTGSGSKPSSHETALIVQEVTAAGLAQFRNEIPTCDLSGCCSTDLLTSSCLTSSQHERGNTIRQATAPSSNRPKTQSQESEDTQSLPRHTSTLKEFEVPVDLATETENEIHQAPAQIATQPKTPARECDGIMSSSQPTPKRGKSEVHVNVATDTENRNRQAAQNATQPHTKVRESDGVMSSPSQRIFKLEESGVYVKVVTDEAHLLCRMTRYSLPEAGEPSIYENMEFDKVASAPSVENVSHKGSELCDAPGSRDRKMQRLLSTL
ncbi:uncharacterized protein [Littorina saxatilis]|uniref:Uncharacterized protein n=1 Tax=Littorina saxatilis TaxID=31220 RepID=A0AAN9B4S0_9CAEN